MISTWKSAPNLPRAFAQRRKLHQDQERVRAKGYKMREKVAVGLRPVPESELVIGIMNIVGITRFGHHRVKFVDNQSFFRTEPVEHRQKRLVVLSGFRSAK